MSIIFLLDSLGLETMADSKRQLIVNELVTTVFEQILIANGSETNLGNHVFEWKTTDFQEVDLPGMTFRDSTETVEVKGQNHYHTLTIEIEAKVSASTSTVTARKVIADIIVAIGQNLGLNDLVANVKPVQNELLDFEQADRKFGTINMQLEVEYVTKAFKPYV